VNQLGLDGREVPHPVRAPARLTPRQQEVLIYMRHAGCVRPVDVGMLMHAGRERPCLTVALIGSCCRHASSDGCDALRRLERRGLVYREARGRWRVVVAIEDWPS
jgi:hypothetical protein